MPILILTLICLVVGGALALMDNTTSPIIETAAAERAKEAMNATIPHAADFERFETDPFEELPVTIKEVYRTTNDVGYIFIAEVGGFSGDITVICGVDPDGNIIGTSTLSHTETQGIGTIIEQESFLGTFAGRDNMLEGVDTVTGATISTRAFIRAIKDIHEAFEQIHN